ncbi:hypothetical protein ACIBL5_06530 [Streptomyces sp. NPDC050516]|uniref:hypothetical protein n=1 Tax=Streptomyces sp. NPDC050516 TaxID=3365621 RepID=UPI0037B2D7F4
MYDIPNVETADSREGFSKGDQMKRAGGQAGDLPEIGVVQCWSTLECAPTEWRCIVTWGGRYTGRYKAHEIEHTAQLERPTRGGSPGLPSAGSGNNQMPDRAVAQVSAGPDWSHMSRADFEPGAPSHLPVPAGPKRIPALPDTYGTEALFGEPVPPKPARREHRRPGDIEGQDELL